MDKENKLPVLYTGRKLALRTSTSLSLVKTLIEEGKADHWFKKGLKFKESENWEAAYFCFEKAISINKDCQDYYPYITLCASIQNKYSTAVNFLIQGLKIFIDWVNFKNQLIIMEWKSIVNALYSVLSDKKNIFNYSDVYIATAIAELACGNVDKSHGLISKIENCESDLKEFCFCLRGLICSFEYNEKKKDTIIYYNKAIELNSNYIAAYNFRAITKLNLSDYEGAILDCNKAINLLPINVYAYCIRGKAKFYLSDFHGAIMDCTEAIELKQNYSDPYIIRGDAQFYLLNYDGAIIDYTQAINIDNINAYKSSPYYVDYYFKRGNAKFNLEDYQGAIEDYKKQFEFFPDHDLARDNIYRAERRLRRLKGEDINLTLLNAAKIFIPYVSVNHSAIIEWINDKKGYFIDSRDGLHYRVVKIGNQVWFAENLAFIPHVSPSNLQSGIWVYGYQGNIVDEARLTENYKRFGCLYDWYKATNNCPAGWHLPSNHEWLDMVWYINDIKGPFNYSTNPPWINMGGILKSFTGWKRIDDNFLGTDDFGFSGLPAGACMNGKFLDVGKNCIWWTSSEEDVNQAWQQYLIYDSLEFTWYYIKKDSGLSVRCLKD